MPKFSLYDRYVLMIDVLQLWRSCNHDVIKQYYKRSLHICLNWSDGSSEQESISIPYNWPSSYAFETQINEEFSENMSWFLLFIEQTTVPKYLNCRTCSIGLPLKFISTLSSAPKPIDFVLISFTMTLLLAQNFRRPSNCLWMPFAESENKMRSSAHKMCAMMTSSMTTPNSLNK